MQKKLGILILALISLVVTSCGCSVKRPSSNSLDSRDESNPSVEPIDPISSETPPDSGEQHVHTFNENSWSNDDQYHWHDSTCGHDVVKDKAEHEFGDWHIAKDPTPTEEGLKYHECTVCGYVAYESIPATGEQHVHEWSSEWSVDETYHWHACTGCSEVADKGEHDLGTPGIDTMTGERSAFCSICRKNIVLPPRQCTITWKNYDGSVLETDTAYTGDTPTYDGPTPSKPSDSEYNYVFAGWAPDIRVVIESTSYTAKFNAVPISGQHEHNFVKNPDTLEYVCSCGEKNGRDYELSITIPQLHVGDLYKAREYAYSFKNNDNALAFGWVAYVVGGSTSVIKNSDSAEDYYFPASLQGKNVQAYVYVGIYDETNIKHQGSGTLTNVDAYANGQLMSKASQLATFDYWQNAITPNLPTNKFYVYIIDIGPLLPTESPDLVAWPTNDVNAAFTAIGLSPFALPQLQDAAITSYDVHVYSGNNGFYIVFYGLKNTGDPDYTVNFYASRLPSLGFTKIDNFQYLSPDETFTVYVASTIGANEQILDIELHEKPKYTVTWVGFNGTVVETDTNVERGTMPHFDGDLSGYQTSAGKAYYYTGWDKTLAPVTADVTYTAQWYESIFIMDEEYDDGWNCQGLVDKNYSGDVVIPKTFYDGRPVKYIAENAFKDCVNVDTLSVSDSVVRIGEGAFANMKSLVGLLVPFVGPTSAFSYNEEYNSLISYFFGTTAGEGLYKISQPKPLGGTYRDAYIPSSLTEITVKGQKVYTHCFEGLSSLQAIYLPYATDIEEYAFSCCTSLKTISLGNNYLDSIGAYAFEATAIESLTLPGSVSSVGSCAFKNCKSLKSFYWSNEDNDLDSVGWNIFAGCKSLETLGFPIYGHISTLFSTASFEGSYEMLIGADMYYMPSSLLTVIDTGGVVSEMAFEQTIITSITITDKVEMINEGALAGANELIDLTIPYVGVDKDATEPSFKTLFGVLFSKTNLGNSITYGAHQSYDSSHYIYYYIPYSLKNVTVTGGNLLGYDFSQVDEIDMVTLQGVKYIGENAFYHCSADVALNEGLETIDVQAFHYSDMNTALVIPDSVKTIGQFAFAYADQITSIVVGANVETLGKSAFSNCKAATSITFRGNKITEIGSSTFNHCDSLTSIVVPEGVTKIGSQAFDYCGALTSVTLPSTLEDIHAASIFAHNEVLTAINYNGTVEQWNAIRKASNWVSSTCPNLKTIHCTNGDVTL